ncbi:MAG: hypothetical protein ACR2JU_13945 [Nocardioidaceae bacterium]
MASDDASLHKDGKDDRDLFLLHWNRILVNAVRETAASAVTSQLHTIDGVDVCRVHVRRHPRDRGRSERERYIKSRWGAPLEP